LFYVSFSKLPEQVVQLMDESIDVPVGTELTGIKLFEGVVELLLLP
jgi:hypothetical protein